MSLLGLTSPGAAYAAELLPALRHAQIDLGPANTGGDLIVSPVGTVTVPCGGFNGGRDLKTFDSSGQLLQYIPRSQQIDGVPNCVELPIVDKSGTVYGVLGGSNNLVAYSGNTVKWKYPIACGYNGAGSHVVGATGNIYATTRLSSGDVRLIGLAPDVMIGQVQPTKVLDVDIPDDCSITLSAYKHGIFLHGQSSGHGRYYSYGGKYLGQATIGDVWYEKIDADGRLFVPKGIAENPRRITISMFSPFTAQVEWSTTASMEGADANLYNIAATAGGVAAVIKERKLISPGVVAQPLEWVDTLVVINRAGQKVKSAQLPNQDSQTTNNHFFSTNLNADNTGKVIVTRQLEMKTPVSWPATVPGIALGVYDPVGDAWIYQSILKGDVDNSADPYGYRLESTYYNGAAKPSPGTLNVMASCKGDCPSNDYNQKLYPVSVPGIGVDYPSGDVLATLPSAQAAPHSYMALGDSFSSGEGVTPFVDTTACHRSAGAYSRVNGWNPYTRLQLDRFVACSGAETTHVLNGWNDAMHAEPSQVSALQSGRPKVVTITIGGNDIGFVDFAQACVLGTCNFGSTVYASTVNAINSTLPAKLEATYRKLLEVTSASTADIYVLGYPHVIADKSAADPGDARCFYMSESVPAVEGRYWEDARAARDVVTRLNTKIADVVAAVRALSPNNQRLVFVPATGGNSPFTGRELCTGSDEAYFHNVDQALNGLSFVFHPNANGQAAYAELVRQAIGE